MDEAAIKEILNRATEIDASQSLSVEENPEYDNLLRSADEAGIKRESVLQALRERLGYVEQPLKADDFVFARVPSGEGYPANVISVESDGVLVKFTSGATLKVPRSAVTPFLGLPGDQVMVPWTDSWWTLGSVDEYVPEKKMVRVKAMGKTKYFMLHELKQPPVGAKAAPTSAQPVLPRLAIAAGSLLVGAGLTYLFMR